MEQYISKNAIIAEIERLISNGQVKLQESQENNDYENYVVWAEHIATCIKVLSLINTLEVKEVETPVIPKHSYFEEIYHCGSEPRWKIGDVLAVYEFYSDYEGEYIYGKITDVKMDETEDWCYTFENGDMVYENKLISDETYKKN